METPGVVGVWAGHSDTLRAFAEAKYISSDAPHDIEHMEHGGNGGFMQGGMHHAVAKGVTLQAKLW